MNEYREFSSYNGLDRVAMFMGVPLLPAVALLTLSVAIMFLGLYFFGMVGFLFALLLLPAALFLRVISETDDRALNMLALEMKFRSKRVAYEEFGKTLTFLPERYLRYEKVAQQFFETEND